MNGRPGPRLAPALALGLALLASPAGAAWGAPTEKEAFLLMFGKGNGAMRLLCALERDGLATREIHAEVPPRVEYSLTPLGATLVDAVSALDSWARSNIGAVEEARARYDAR